MKTRTNKLLLAFALMAMSVLPGCNSAAENLQDAQHDADDANENLRIANEEYLTDVQNFKVETAALIAKNDSLILEYKVRMNISKRDKDAYSKSEMAKLEMKNDELRRKMNDYEGDGKDNWTIFKEEFKHDMDELGAALKDITVRNTN